MAFVCQVVGDPGRARTLMTSVEPPATDPWDLGDNASASPASTQPSPAIAAAAAAAASGDLTDDNAAFVVFIGKKTLTILI